MWKYEETTIKARQDSVCFLIAQENGTDSEFGVYFFDFMRYN